MLILQFDGLYRNVPGGPETINNAGFMCYGWVITRDGQLIAHGHGSFGRSRHASSNIAEYLALIEGLDALVDLGSNGEAVEIRGDAKSIIDQMRGVACVSAQTVRPLYRQAQKLAARLPQACWRWMPRRENRDADQLSRRAMRQLKQDRCAYEAAVETILAGTYKLKNTTRLLPLADLRVYR